MFCSFSYWMGKWLACLAQPDILLFLVEQLWTQFFHEVSFHVILWFQMFHWTQPHQWHQDGKTGQPKKWEGAWEEEQLSQSSRLLSPQAINGLWMALSVSHMQKMRILVFPTIWVDIVLKGKFCRFSTISLSIRVRDIVWIMDLAGAAAKSVVLPTTALSWRSWCQKNNRAPQRYREHQQQQQAFFTLYP